MLHIRRVDKIFIAGLVVVIALNFGYRHYLHNDMVSHQPYKVSPVGQGMIDNLIQEDIVRIISIDENGDYELYLSRIIPDLSPAHRDMIVDDLNKQGWLDGKTSVRANPPKKIKILKHAYSENKWTWMAEVPVEINISRGDQDKTVQYYTYPYYTLSDGSREVRPRLIAIRLNTEPFKPVRFNRLKF